MNTSRNRLIFYAVVGGIVLIGGYFIYKSAKGEATRKYINQITGGLGGRGMEMIGSWANNIPFLGKKESQEAISTMKNQKSPVPAHSQGIPAPKPSFQDVYPKKYMRTDTKSPAATNRRMVGAGQTRFNKPLISQRTRGRPTPPKLAAREQRRATSTGATRRSADVRRSRTMRMR